MKSYCSAECQRKDWPSHKKQCKSMAAAKAAAAGCIGIPAAGVALPRAPGGSMSMPVATSVGNPSGTCGREGCQQPGLYRCGQCQMKSYCSADCQKTDWPA